LYSGRDGRVSFSVMNSRKREGGLTGEEKRIVKALLSQGREIKIYRRL